MIYEVLSLVFFTEADTWVFPTLEMGQIGIHHDSLIVRRILASAVSGSGLKMATGYFNLTDTYMKALTNECVANCSILMAHPNVIKLELLICFIFQFFLSFNLHRRTDSWGQTDLLKVSQKLTH